MDIMPKFIHMICKVLTDLYTVFMLGVGYQNRIPTKLDFGSRKKTMNFDDILWLLNCFE